VVDGHITPDIIFTDADPPVGGLRTWPQTWKNGKNTPSNITKLADLHSSLRKLIRTHPFNTTTRHGTIYSQILHESRTTGSDHTIHAYSTAPFRARRDSMEVAWGVHIHGKENTAHLSYVPSASPRSQTHTYLEAANSPPSSELNATTVHSDFYSNSYKNRMEDAGPSYVRTWAINPLPTLVTSRLT
jgi:hypothetical protein